MSTSGALSSERFSKHCVRWCVKTEIVCRESCGGEILQLKCFLFLLFLPHLQFDAELRHPHCHPKTTSAVLPEAWDLQVWGSILPCSNVKELYTSLIIIICNQSGSPLQEVFHLMYPYLVWDQSHWNLRVGMQKYSPLAFVVLRYVLTSVLSGLQHGYHQTSTQETDIEWKTGR